MPQTLASDMARKSFGALLERVEQQHDFSSDEAQELLASCEIGSLVLEKLWNLTQRFLDRGMERKKLTLLLKEFVDVMNSGIRAFGTARDRVRLANLTAEERAEGMARLEQLGRRAAEMRDRLSALLCRLEIPPPAVTPSSLPGGREANATQGYVDLQDLTSRLLSGGDA